MPREFVIGLTADYLTEGLAYVEDFVCERLAQAPGVSYRVLEPMSPVAQASVIDEVDAVLSLAIGYNTASFQGLERLALIARWGVGYDMVDMDACTAAGVGVAITPRAIGPAVAEGALTLVLALLKRLPEKDASVRRGGWRRELSGFGRGTRGVTLGTVGLGNIGSEMMRMSAGLPFARRLAYDPYVAPEQAERLGVQLVSLPELMRQCDVVTVNCPLNESTRCLIGAAELSLMKPTAYLVNTARGPIVDQMALTDALQRRAIAGAALDVLEREPPAPDDPILAMDNVILAPHAIAWNDEMAWDVTAEALDACLAVAQGEVPTTLVNRSVLNHSRFSAILKRNGSLA